MGRISGGLVSGVWVSLLFVALFGVVLNVPLVKASGTIYIRADGSIDPPTANITTTDKVTYIFTGNNYDSIVVERNNITIDGNGYTLQGTGAYDSKGIDLTGRSNVTIKNARITAFYYGYGIYLNDSSGNSISGNNIANNDVGIYLSDSSNNSVSGNNVTANDWLGIYLDYSDHNSIAGNNIVNNGAGIRLYFSSHNSVSGNNITNNGSGIWLDGYSSNNFLRDNFMTNNARNFDVNFPFVHDVDSSNTVDGKPVYYWVNMRDLTVPLDAGYVALVNCTNITVENLTLTKNGQGILLVYTTNSTITQNRITNNPEGILLWGSSNNSISGNNIAINSYGIDLVHSSNNTIHGNDIRNNSWGVYLYNCSNNNIFGNSITGNGGPEVFGYGVCLAESSNNSICGNEIRNNTYRGICLWLDSSNNTIYHNEFMNNTSHVDLDVWTEVINIWDDGYPSGGNYWSDYTGADEFSGPNQDQPGSDGIGDIPYVINEDNRDRYPLMAPKHELAVSIIAPISLRVGSSSMLTATITNKGSSEEASVELRLIINGTIVNSTIVPILQPSDSYTLNYLWTPTVEGIYNVTAYAPPISDEALIENNQQTIFVNVSAPEIFVSIMAPAFLRLGASSSLKATVSNQGLSNETNVELALFINGTTVSSTTIPLLQAGNSYTLTYLWTPTIEGTYNLTAYAHPVSGETSIQNNQMTKFVTVSVPPEVRVGVKAGDWIKCTYTISGWPSGTPYPEWLKIEFLSVEGTTATISVTMHMSDRTEQSDTLTVDVAGEGETFQGLSGFVIPANCTTGDSIYMTGYGNVTIAGETTRTYAGASRTVVYASFSQYGTELTYYWDKQTGVMVEASMISGSVTATAKATETNMWQATPWFPIDPIILYALIPIIIVIVTAIFLMRRKKKLPEIQKTETQPQNSL